MTSGYLRYIYHKPAGMSMEDAAGWSTSFYHHGTMDLELGITLIHETYHMANNTVHKPTQPTQSWSNLGTLPPLPLIHIHFHHFPSTQLFLTVGLGKIHHETRSFSSSTIAFPHLFTLITGEQKPLGTVGSHVHSVRQAQVTAARAWKILVLPCFHSIARSRFTLKQ